MTTIDHDPTLRTDLRPYLRAVLRDPTLTSGDRVVAWTVASYAYGGAVARPSRETLARDTGLHVRSVRRSVERLAAAGVFATEYRTGRPTVYRFPAHPAHAEISTTWRPTAPADRAPTGATLETDRAPYVPEPGAVVSQTGRPTAPRSKEVKERNRERDDADTVDNYGDAGTAKRLRALLESARDETRRAS